MKILSTAKPGERRDLAGRQQCGYHTAPLEGCKSSFLTPSDSDTAFNHHSQIHSEYTSVSRILSLYQVIWTMETSSQGNWDDFLPLLTQRRGRKKKEAFSWGNERLTLITTPTHNVFPPSYCSAELSTVTADNCHPEFCRTR